MSTPDSPFRTSRETKIRGIQVQFPQKPDEFTLFNYMGCLFFVKRLLDTKLKGQAFSTKNPRLTPTKTVFYLWLEDEMSFQKCSLLTWNCIKCLEKVPHIFSQMVLWWWFTLAKVKNHLQQIRVKGTWYPQLPHLKFLRTRSDRSRSDRR